MLQLVPGGPDEKEELTDEQPNEILTVVQMHKSLHVLRNKVGCAGDDRDLMHKKSTQQTQLTYCLDPNKCLCA